ncbi:MAG: ECF-type sigma factor [Bacteroidota bacterium]
MSAPPPDAPAGDVTRLLDALRRGEADSEALFRRLYDELRRLARHHRARWHGNETLNTTALVHEAYFKLIGSVEGFENRSHVLGVASRAMRQVLVTYAEAQRALKRGGGVPDIPLDDALQMGDPLLSDEQAETITALDEALVRLGKADERAARVVECRFFGGMTVEETAEALDLSVATVGRSWRAARAWLYGELKPTPLLDLG